MCPCSGYALCTHLWCVIASSCSELIRSLLCVCVCLCVRVVWLPPTFASPGDTHTCLLLVFAFPSRLSVPRSCCVLHPLYCCALFPGTPHDYLILVLVFPSRLCVPLVCDRVLVLCLGRTCVCLCVRLFWLAPHTCLILCLNPNPNPKP